MNKLQGILPAKTLTMIQSIVCLILMLIVVFMSFGTVFTAKVNASPAAIEMYDSVINSLDSDKFVSMPTEVDISAPFLFKSLGSAANVLKSALDTAKSATDLNKDIQSNNIDQQTANDDLENLKSDANKLAENLQDDGFVDFVALIVVVVSAFGTNMLLGIVYVALIGLTISLPIVATVRFLIALVAFLKNIKNLSTAPENVYSTVAKSYGSIFAMFPTLWLMKIIAPQVEFSAGVVTMIVLLIAGLVLNLVASRLKGYTPSQFKYINVLQLTSLCAVIGYFIFMLNISGMNFFDHIWEALPRFIKVAEFTDLLLPYVMIMAMISILCATCKYVQRIACRLCCTVPCPKRTADMPMIFANDTHIVSTSFALGLIVAPIILMVTKFNLNLGDDMSSFILFAIGIVIMFASEIALMVLKKKLGCTSMDVHAVLTGCPGEICDEASTAEAPAAECAACEENTVEAPIVEDAPVSEDAPASEDTPVQVAIDIDANKDAE